MKTLNGWKEISVLPKSKFTDEYIQGVGIMDGKKVYFENPPIQREDKWFINEINIIAYESTEE